MEDFYKEICDTTKIITTNVPKQATVEIYVKEALEFITNNWRIYTRIAALSGYKQAYFGIFQKSFKIRKRVELYKYFEPNDETRELFESYKIELLEDQLAITVDPFQIELTDFGDTYAITICWE